MAASAGGSGQMAQRLLIKVVGFSDVERHALNTVFRLSGQHDTCYGLWTPEATDPPQLLLLDGLSWEARLQAESPSGDGLKRVWVGESPPEGCWRVFQRPIAWPEVLQALDELFAPAPLLDFDLDFGETLPPAPAAPVRRALIASADRDERLYLRAKLALARLTQADEAENAARLMELLRSQAYAVALVDVELPGGEGWALLEELARAQPAVPHLIVTKAEARWWDAVRARRVGVHGFFGKPPHPGKLQEMLQKL
jgi:CheY-like chemotaxis protein